MLFKLFLLSSNLLLFLLLFLSSSSSKCVNLCFRDRRICHPISVGFTTTYVISAYHHWCCEFGSRSGRDVQHYVIKVVSNLRQVDGFLRVLWFPPPTKLTDTIQLIYCRKRYSAPSSKKPNTHMCFIFINSMFPG
jgi:hypothetical protein